MTAFPALIIAYCHNSSKPTPAIQRWEMSKAIGVSLDKADYRLQALVQKGLVKLDNFCRAENKLVYCYLLNSSGSKAKTRLTVCFFMAVSNSPRKLAILRL